MFDAKRLVDQLVGSGVAGGFAGGLAGEEYGRPIDVQSLIAAVDSPQHAAEVYAASVMMLDPPSPPEQIYLDTLSRALGLET